MAHQMTREERAIKKVIEHCRPHGPTTTPTTRGSSGQSATWVVSATHAYEPTEPTLTVTVTATVTQEQGGEAEVEVETRPGGELYDVSIRPLALQLVRQL